VLRYVCLLFLFTWRTGFLFSAYSFGGGAGVYGDSDEVAQIQIKHFVETNKYRYPMVLMGEGQDYKLVMDNNELAACNGNALQLVQKLREKGAFSSPSTSSL